VLRPTEVLLVEGHGLNPLLLQRRWIDHFVSIYPDQLQPTSILREFIRRERIRILS
jgi:hypothetical protein